jgi:hypothetical protein
MWLTEKLRGGEDAERLWRRLIADELILSFVPKT